MRVKQYLIWLVVFLAATLTLTACVRPYPQPDEAPVPESDQDLVMTQPAIQPELEQPTPLEAESLPVATPLPALTTEAVPPTEEPAQDQIHVIQAGETLFQIASLYGVTIDLIVAANEIPDVNQLEVGQELLIPAPGSIIPTTTSETVAGETPAPEVEATVETPEDGTHVVQAGENLYRIGLRYGCSVEQMATANGIVNPARIAVGQVLQIPDCS